MNDMKFTNAGDYMATSVDEVSDEYDVVIDVLSKHQSSLWEMTRRNMTSEFVGMNIMDDIRMQQIDKLQEAMDMWNSRHTKL